MRTDMSLSSRSLKMHHFFVDCAGIESPGLSSAPAIGERVAAIVE